MLRSLLVSALIARSAATNLAAQKPNLLKLRGGVGIDATLAAKGFTAISSANAAATYLAPGPTAEGYGISNASPLSLWFMEFSGATLISYCILAWCALSGMDTTKALAWATIPWLTMSAKDLLNGKAAEIGVDVNGQYFNAAVTTFIAWALFTGWNAETVAKYWCGWGLFNAVNCAYFADLAGKMWGVPSEEQAKFFVKSFGYFLGGYSTLGGSLLLGNDANTAIAHSIGVFVLNIIDQKWVAKGFDKWGDGDDTPLYVWLAIMAGTAASILL